jgi:hypothetical protein
LPRYAIFAIAAIVVGVVAGAVIAGSGGGDSNPTTHSVPDLLPPPGSIRTDKGATGATGKQGTSGASGQQAPSGTQTQTTTTPSSGGAQSPSNDTQQHDVPPPKGSPAQRFEEFCKQNPGAC